MIELRSARRLEEAYGSKIDRILVDTLQSGLFDFQVQCNRMHRPLTISSSEDNILDIIVGCSVNDFDDFKYGFRSCYLSALAQQLELSTSESIILGDVFHARRLGNNSSYPIYVLTKTRKILVGYLNSNQDLIPKIHYIYIENTKKERVLEKTVRLKCLD